jgi:peptidylprolyl isomerase
MSPTRPLVVLLAALLAGACGSASSNPPAETLDAADVDAPIETAAPAETPAAGEIVAAAEEAASAAGLPGEPLPEGASFVTTESGLRYAVLSAADSGEPCGPNDIASVHYTGYFEDGRQFDASNKAGAPARFSVGGVIAGWTEGLQLMRPGEKYKLFIPWELAYGETGYPGAIPPKANLIFDVELVDVTPGPKPMEVPEFLLPADDQLTTTESGLQYFAIEAGSGDPPGPTDTVTVHYAGWLTDGTPFDSSYGRGEPTTFPLDRVIPGWTEGLQLMSPGAEYVLVIPPDLAYGEAGAGGVIGPNATLVFKVSLLSIGG